MGSAPGSPEAKARKNIDKQLAACGWIVQSRDEANVLAGRGVAIRRVAHPFARLKL